MKTKRDPFRPYRGDPVDGKPRVHMRYWTVDRFLERDGFTYTDTRIHVPRIPDFGCPEVIFSVDGGATCSLEKDHV